MVKRGDTRVLREKVRQLSEGEYFRALMEPAWGERAEGTPGQRVLASTTYFLNDVANGGLEQALWNFDPADVDLVLESLDRLGASAQATVVRASMIYLLGRSPSESLERRRALIEKRSRQWLDTNIEPLNEQLYDETCLWPYYHQYIEKHPTEFFQD